jgi:hypothetical protein
MKYEPEKDSVAPENAKEVNEVVALLKQAPEIMAKVDYYKAILKAQDLLIGSLEDRINRSNDIILFKLFGFIPIPMFKKVSNYERGKLLIEKIEAENQMYYQKQYFENWLKRKQEYEVYFDKLSGEANENFDRLFDVAKEVARTNMRLAGAISKYEKEDKERNDQTLKNEFYLYIKQEVKNRAELGKPKTMQKV